MGRRFARSWARASSKLHHYQQQQQQQGQQQLLSGSPSALCTYPFCPCLWSALGYRWALGRSSSSGSRGTSFSRSSVLETMEVRPESSAEWKQHAGLRAHWQWPSVRMPANLQSCCLLIPQLPWLTESSYSAAEARVDVVDDDCDDDDLLRDTSWLRQK